MAMTAGTVVIEDNGTVSTSTGFAGELYDDLWADYVADLLAANPPQVPTTDPALLARIRRSMARVAMTQAKTITYIKANGQAEISTSLGALQRASGVDTTAPSTTKHIPIV